MKFHVASILILIFFASISYSQDTIVLYPQKDAVIDFFNPDQNYGDSEFFVAETSDSPPEKATRSLIQFNLESLSSETYIYSAVLVVDGISHDVSSGDNSFKLQRLTEDWDESTVTWQDKPSATSTDEVLLQSSQSSGQDYQIDLKLHIRDMIEQQNNFGFVLQLQSETENARIQFASSDNGSYNSPKLVIVHEDPSPINVINSIEPISCASQSDGSIQVFVDGGISPYSFEISDESEPVSTTNFLFDAAAGNYTIEVTDQNSVSVTMNIGLGFLLEWDSDDNCVMEGSHSLVKANNNGVFCGGGKSKNILFDNEDGWIEFTVDNVDQLRAIGFSDESNSLYGCFSSMDFGFYLTDNGDLIGVLHGQQFSFSDDQYDLGDVLRIERSGDVINFYKNNLSTPLHTISETGISEIDLVADAAMYNIGNHFQEIRSSFDIPLRLTADVEADYSEEGESPTGSIDLTIQCGTGPYTFSWSNGSTTEDLSGLLSGEYDVVIYDGNNRPSYNTYVVCYAGGHNVRYDYFYNLNGIENGRESTFIDNLGREIQKKSVNKEINRVVVSESKYDRDGRLGISSLPAVINSTNSFCYKDNFITDIYGQPYDVDHFDDYNYDNPYLDRTSTKCGTKYMPKYVGRSNNNLSLGDYYSEANNMEPYVASDLLPYSRVEYHDDIQGRPRKVTNPGVKTKMGSGREISYYYSRSAGELSAASSYDFSVFKTITIDPQGKTFISYKNTNGDIVSTCRSGIQSTCDQKVRKTMKYYADNSVVIHLPASKRSSLKFVLNKERQCSTSAFVKYRIVDIERGYELKTQFNSQNNYDAIIGGGGAVAFQNYRNGEQLFLRVSFEYEQNYIENVYPVRNYGEYLPDQYVEYTLDYSQWSLYEYDRRTGLVLNSFSPKSIECVSTTQEQYGFKEHTTSNQYYAYDHSGSNWQINTSNTFEETYDASSTAAQGVYNSSSVGVTKQSLRIDLSTVPHAIAEVTGTDPCSNFSHIVHTPDPNLFPVRNKVLDYGTSNGGTTEALKSTPLLYAYDNGDPSELTSSDEDALEAMYLSLGDFNNSPVSNNELIVIDGGLLLPAIAPSDPCSSTEHCFDGILNCDETDVNWMGSGIDIGPGCPLPKCYGYPPEKVAEFLLIYKVTGNHSSSGVVEIDDEGKVSAGIRHHAFATLYKNCKCEYFWDWKSLTKPRILIEHDELVNLSDVKIQLESIKVRSLATGGGSTYKNHSSAGFIGQFARFITFVVDAKHSSYPITVSSPSHSFKTEYDYDEEERLVSMNSPDEGEVEYVYDNANRLRFSQTSQQLIDRKFTYNVYDDLDRIVETGVHSYPDPCTGCVDFRNTSGDIDASIYILANEKHGLTGTAANYNDERTYFLFDINDGLSNYKNPFTGTDPHASSSWQQRFLKSRMSKSWTEDENNNISEITWYSYDALGRLSFTVKWIEDIDEYRCLHYTYDAKGNLEKTFYNEHYSTGKFAHHYEYNANDQLENVESSVDGSTKKQEAKYIYYKHGPLKRVELGDDLQGIDYVYTLDGKLKSINSASFDHDPGQDGLLNPNFAPDVFGMEIDYYSGDYIRNNTFINYGDNVDNRFDGLIKAVRWNYKIQSSPDMTAPNSKQWAYVYDYDEHNFLKSAKFGLYKSNCQNMSLNYACASGQNYSVVFSFGGTGSSSSPNPGACYGSITPIKPSSSNNFQKFVVDPNDKYKVEYTYGPDPSLSLGDVGNNGNLLTLKRNSGNQTNLLMDDLKYNYGAGNFLDHVDDNVTAQNFSDFTDQAVNNYSRNDDGKLESDASNNLSYFYDHNGKIIEIKDNGNTIQKINYDEFGRRSKTRFYTSSGTVLSRTLHYTYDVNGNLLESYDVRHLESVVDNNFTLYGLSRLGFYNGATEAYGRYEITDHLGNIRALIKRTKNNGEAQVEDYADYYPNGMKMPGKVMVSGTQQGENRAYQGKELDNEIEQTIFELRNYAHQLGIWLNPDPMKQYHSPYLAMGNNPIINIDPNGGYDYSIYGRDYNPYAYNNGEYDGLTGDFTNNPLYSPPSYSLMTNRMDWVINEDGTVFHPTWGMEMQKLISMGVNLLTEFELVENKYKWGRCGKCADISTLGYNTYGVYTGEYNLLDNDGNYNYSWIPHDPWDYPAIGHDRRFDKMNIIDGKEAVIYDTRVIGADYKYVQEQFMNALNTQLNLTDRFMSVALGMTIGIAAAPKTIIHFATSGPTGFAETLAWYRYSNTDKNNKPITNIPDVHEH